MLLDKQRDCQFWAAPEWNYSYLVNYLWRMSDGFLCSFYFRKCLQSYLVCQISLLGLF